MTELLDDVVSISQPETRTTGSDSLGRHLGGTSVIVFVRDDAIGVLLPAPGYPQTLPDARAWRSFVADCVRLGESHIEQIDSPMDCSRVSAYGVAGGTDIVMAVLGTGTAPGRTNELRQLLPLLASIFKGERSAANAEAHARIARDAARRSEALATALDRARSGLQKALSDAEDFSHELEAVNLQLQDQAMEVEAQTEEAQAQSEELALQADQLQHANSQLEKARDAAEKANRAKSEFLAVMSHELRTPLNAIGGHVQLIELGIYGAVTEQQKEALARVDRGQRRLLGLINDILNLARIEAGKVEYRVDRVSISSALEDLRSMVEPQLRNKDLAYEVSPPDESLAVLADRDKVQQVLLNLLSNAIKFTPAGGKIAVTYVAPAGEGKVGITVEDTGIGLAKERLQDIFEPFVQVEGGRTREGHGTGLGLSISRDLARGMKGDITLESTPGEGSAFTLWLPSAGTTTDVGTSLSSRKN